MKELTQEEALAEIFGRSPLTDSERLWKCRYKKGELSTTLLDKILLDNGYVISNPAKYKKK